LRHECRYNGVGTAHTLIVPVDDVLKLDVKNFHVEKRKALSKSIDDEFLFRLMVEKCGGNIELAITKLFGEKLLTPFFVG